MTGLQRWLLHLSFLLLLASGGAYAVMKYLLESDDPYSAVGHPLQPWALAIHVVVAPVAVFAVGLIFTDHIAGRIRRRANGAAGRGNGGAARGPGGPGRPNGAGRGSGMAATLLLPPMIASGYLLQVATGEALRTALGVGHLALGLAYAICYIVHLLRARTAEHGRTAESSRGLLAIAAGPAGGPGSRLRRGRVRP